MDERRVKLPDGVLAVRAGPGANCSSIGSVIDLLFGTAIAASALYAAVSASLPDRGPAPRKAAEDADERETSAPEDADERDGAAREDDR